MDDSSNSKRLIFATGLSLLLVFAVNFLFPTPPPVDQGSSEAPGVATSTATGTAPREDAAAAGDGVGIGNRPAAPTVSVERQTFTFQGEVAAENGETGIPFEVELTNIGGGIERFILPTFRERNKDNQPTEEPVKLANPTQGLPDARAAMTQMASVTFGSGTTFRTPTLIPYEVVEAKPDFVRYRYTTPEGVEIEREYSLSKDSFQIELAVTVRNRSEQPQTHNLQISNALEVTDAMKKGSGFFANFVPPPDHLDGLCHAEGTVERASQVSLADESSARRYSERVRWVATDRQYFVSALVLRDRSDATCELRGDGDLLQASLVIPGTTLQPGEEKRHKFTAYLGVKKPSLLTLVDAELEGAVDYRILGMNLAPLCTGLLWILGLFHGFTGSWGLAILGLTFLVKLVLFPLNQRSGKSMRAMSQLKPAMDAIREKFADDRQRQSEEMMKLYREHGVNPAGGCLPVLIQMPIWFALYRSLWASVDLYQQGFLWIADLTTPDPYWILPVVLTGVMFLQQKMTPTTMDPAQQKIMTYTMPLVFGVMMAALPAGLSFYILVNTLLTIVQQHFINKSLGPIGGSRSARGATA